MGPLKLNFYFISVSQRIAGFTESLYWKLRSPKKKKKVFAEIRRLFLAEITNSNVFSAQKHATSSSQKNTVGVQEKNRGGKNENLATRLRYHKVSKCQKKLTFIKMLLKLFHLL